MEKVFICADRKFPHGDAGGNRIEYLAQCLLAQGIQPIVISMGENNRADKVKARMYYRYNKIIYKNIKLKSGKIGQFEKYFCAGKYVGQELKKFKIKSGTTIVIYTSNPFFAKQITGSIPKKLKCKYYYDVVEWFDETCYKFGKWDPKYKIFKKCFNDIYTSGNGVIAISKNIERHFASLGCETAYFPICMDASKFKMIPNHQFDKVIHYIYPGNPEHKDDIVTMLRAIDALELDEKERIKFHFTAVSEKTIRNILGGYGYLLENLKKTVIFHPWMEYDELLKLYGQVDSLFMLRLDNLVTKSNFPSKVPELLACGVIITANDSGDFFSFLSEGTDSIKITQNTVDACVDAIRQLLHLSEQKRRQMSLAAIKCANEQFNYLKYSDSISEFLLRK